MASYFYSKGCSTIFNSRKYVLSQLFRAQLGINSIYPRLKETIANDFLRRLFSILSVDVLARASGVLLIPVFLRLMPQYQFGVFGYIIAFVNSVAMIANFGLYVAQVKLVSQESDERLGEIVFTLHALLFGLLAAVFISTYLFDLDIIVVRKYLKLDINFEKYRIFLVILIISYVIAVMQKTYFMAVQDILMLQISNVARIVLCNGAVIAVLAVASTDQSLVRIRATALSEALVGVLFSYYIVKNMRFTFSYKTAKKALKIGIPVMLSAVLSLIYMLSDKVMLEKYIGFEQLATYNLSATVASIIPLVISSFQTIYSPMFFKDSEFSLTKTMRIISLLGIAFLAISLGIEAVLYIALKTAVISSKYHSILWISPLLLIAAVLQALTQVLANYFILVERTSLNLLIGVGSTILTVGLNLLFIPTMHIAAAAVSGIVTGLAALATTYFVILALEEQKKFAPVRPLLASSSREGSRTAE